MDVAGPAVGEAVLAECADELRLVLVFGLCVKGGLSEVQLGVADKPGLGVGATGPVVVDAGLAAIQVGTEDGPRLVLDTAGLGLEVLFAVQAGIEDKLRLVLNVGQVGAGDDSRPIHIAGPVVKPVVLVAVRAGGKDEPGLVLDATYSH